MGIIPPIFGPLPVFLQNNYIAVSAMVQHLFYGGGCNPEKLEEHSSKAAAFCEL
jgi:hypothetical protein